MQFPVGGSVEAGKDVWTNSRMLKRETGIQDKWGDA